MSSSRSGPPPLPTLIVTGGPSDGTEMQLEAPGSEKSIGSGLSSHLRLSTRNVDARHARVVWEDAAVILSDEGSAAGTFVNGERVAGSHVLQDGDRISIGPPGSPESVRLLVRVPGDLASAAAAVPMNLAPGTGMMPAFPADEDPVFFAEETPAPAPAAFAPPAPAPPPAPPTPAIVFDEPVAPAPVRAAAAASPAAVPAAVPAAAASPPPPGPVRTPRSSTPAVRPDYMPEMPSIGGDRVREAPEVAPAAPAARPAAGRARARSVPPNLQRIGIVGGTAALLTLAAFYAYSHLHRPPPVLAGITPFKAEVGTAITITGTGFETSASDNTVRFGDAVATVTNASPTSLGVTVPAIPGVVTKEVPITVQGSGGRSNALFVKIVRLPRIVRVEPDVAVPGMQVTIHGQNLDGAAPVVKIGLDRVQVRDARPDSMRATVPEMSWTDGQSVPVTVEVGTDTARAVPLLMGRLPLVLDVAPGSGLVGERVTIKGRGFDAAAAGNRVTVGGAPALVLAARENELQVAVPAAAPGSLPVVVEARGAASSGRSTFALARPMSGNVRLRFFPAAVPQGPPDKHAFVATEIGPVLLLTGKADAPSTAERAVRVATALTSIADAASSRPVSFEVREGAAPAVAVAGGAVVVAATAEDADGYAQPWDTGVKPSRATPRQVAAYWTALLQDYVTLFAQGQRPSRTAEMSARGKVLVDVYAEAQRRGAGGVPVATVYELSPAALKSVRDMALLVPASVGSGTGGMAVAGRWEGTMADTEAERSIEVRLEVDGGRLAGSLTSKTGAIAMRTPLQQVTYDKGLLKFLATSGGGIRQFRGNLDGSTLSGSIYKDAGAKDPIGRFSLRYVE